jgi:hypothetical protein
VGARDLSLSAMPSSEAGFRAAPAGDRLQSSPRRCGGRVALVKYVRGDGETEILKEMVEGVLDGKRMPGFVVVTDRRVLVQVGRESKMLRWLFGPFVMRWMKDVAPLEMTHQIERDDFASVEHEGKEMISFHSKGSGYAHVSFVAYSQTPFHVWQERMHQWAAGTLSAAPIPTATVVDR